jgi:UDP-N-acetylglucosamine 4,6-dehydratase/5-epimerase
MGNKEINMLKDIFKNKTVFLTGGTGSFGNKFAEQILNKFNPKMLIVYSRDEMKQYFMNQKFNNTKIKFITGDVRDKDRLTSTMTDVDYVVHAAATKIVPAAELNPSESVKTNIIGAMNVIEACKSNNIKKIVALSTDKASNPVNFYGATKLASDKLFVASNNFSKKNESKFSIVRYGNVMGSRGSIIPFFLELKKKNKPYLITDKRMTRFMITLEQSVNLVIQAFNDMEGGEIYVKKIPSMNIMDILNAIDPKPKIKLIGIRPGEKLHEQMIGYEDSVFTYEYSSFYKILPNIAEDNYLKKMIKNGKKVKRDFIYNSQNNKDYMDINFLTNWILDNSKTFL